MTGYSPSSVSRTPNARVARIVASTLVLIQVGVFFSWTQDYLTSVALAVLAWSAGLGIRVPGRTVLQSRRTYIVLGLLISLKHAASPVEVAPLRDYAGTSQVAFEVALFGMLTQIGLLFGYVGRRIPHWYAAFPTISLVFLSDVALRSDAERNFLLGIVITCVALVAALFRLSREQTLARSSNMLPDRLRYVPLAISISLAAMLGATTSVLLVKYERVVDRFLAGTISTVSARAGTTAFSGDGRIANVASWKREGADRIAIRVFSDNEPGYVAGMKFATYTGRGWTNGRDSREEPRDIRFDSRPVVPTNVVRFDDTGEQREESADIAVTVPGPPAGRKLFKLEDVIPLADRQAAAQGTRAVFELWPEKHVPAKVFRPGNANFVASIDETLSVDPLGNVTLSKDERGARQTLYEVEALRLEPPYGDVRSALIQLDAATYPDELAAILAKTNADIFGERDPAVLSTQQKCQAVERYFATNYQYSLGVSMGRANGARLVASFLQDPRRTGHCEYFASAAALLLREAGVATRYATGFVVEETNDIGGYWLARDRDAHAWAEAWDEEAGLWRIVEATPSVGVPEGVPDAAQNQFADAIKTMVRRWRASIQERNLQAELTARAAELLSPSTLLVIGCLAALGAVYLSYKQRRVDRADGLAEYHAVLSAMTDCLGRAGLRRHDSETLHSFAARVADDGDAQWALPAAQWLNRYAALRYRRDRSTLGAAETQLHSLGVESARLTQQIRASRRAASRPNRVAAADA